LAGRKAELIFINKNKSMDITSALTQYEQAMLDFYNGETDNIISIIREDGFEIKVPVRYLYGNTDNFSSIDNKALSMCKGRVLDVGAGSGNHSLFLQKMDYEVYALEMLPALIKILKLRGVKHILKSDVFQLKNITFDTIIMLGHGLGIAQDLSGLVMLFQKLQSLIHRDGIILCDSLDVSKTDIHENLEYQKNIEKMGRYRGEVQFKFRYKNTEGSLLKWLHVDFGILTEIADQNNMLCELVHNDDSGNFLVQLQVK
jgi:predicted RNA methylase